MTWNQRYRIRSYFASSLWVIAVGAVGIELMVASLVHSIEARLGWSGIGLGLEGARALANAVITLSLSFVVFTFGSLLVAIQVASGQYTPRIIATTLLRDNVIRYTVGLFVFTLLFAIKMLNHLEVTVPPLITFITGLLGLTCLVAFLFLIDYVARFLRPVSLVHLVGRDGLAVIEAVYPQNLPASPHAAAAEPPTGAPARALRHHGGSAFVLAVDVKRLIAAAENADGVIELSPQVGDFLGADEPVFLLHGGAAAINDQTLRECVIFGSERTMEQDPQFAFRILVDIAIKALSAAINDPTTAVLAINQLHRLLRSAGQRNLRTDYIVNRDGTLRVILRTPKWEDFVHLAVTEIRLCGAGNIQIARRLRVMMVNLANTLAPERQTALRRELGLLDRLIEKLYLLPEDIALARIPDSQGLGGSTGAEASEESA